MSNFDDHPTIQKLKTSGVRIRASGDAIQSNALLAFALEHGADDCGFVSIDNPALGEEREHVLRCFPATRTLISVVRRMHREQVRSPARSLANLEFHKAGDKVDDIACDIVRYLEDLGVRAVNPAMAFPMELDRFPARGWVVSHKIVAQAAGLGKMGIHRSLIHPRFGSFILLGTVLVAADVSTYSQLLDYNPCLECKLCVAACPVGAIKADGYFDFSACYTHNYQQFMGGFVNWIEDLVESQSVREYANRVTYSETVKRWQSLSYRPNYNSAYCIAVCPAGEDVVGPYLENKKAHLEQVVRPLQEKVEEVYVVKGTDAVDHVARRFPHKQARFSRSNGRATNIANFLAGVSLAFQREKAGSLTAIYHFTFNDVTQIKATLAIKNRTLTVDQGHQGQSDLLVVADADAWIRFLNHEVSIIWCLITRKIRLKGPLRLLREFGRCFPS